MEYGLLGWGVHCYSVRKQQLSLLLSWWQGKWNFKTMGNQLQGPWHNSISSTSHHRRRSIRQIFNLSTIGSVHLTGFKRILVSSCHWRGRKVMIARIRKRTKWTLSRTLNHFSRRFAIVWSSASRLSYQRMPEVLNARKASVVANLGMQPSKPGR